jgi:hypothetical protein
METPEFKTVRDPTRLSLIILIEANVVCGIGRFESNIVFAKNSES